jgi:hypothetical protein
MGDNILLKKTVLFGCLLSVAICSHIWTFAAQGFLGKQPPWSELENDLADKFGFAETIRHRWLGCSGPLVQTVTR